MSADPTQTMPYTDEQRALMKRHAELQLEIARTQLEVLPIKIAALDDPTKANFDALEFISRTKLAGLRREQSTVALDILKSAVDIPGLKAMLPMLVSVLASKIDLAVILAAFNIDPDQVGELTTLLKKYISL